MATSRNGGGDDTGLPHSLIPLTLAVTLLRHKVYGDRQITDQGLVGDLNMLANFIACAVPVYEYFSDSSEPPVLLGKAALEGGIFREGGGELRFLDGRPAKRLLALSVTDFESVTALLRDPKSGR